MEKILVVDDDRDIVLLLEKFLTKHGYEVETAFSGADGEKKVEKFQPDLVMSDYRLDDMDGVTMLTKIKQINPAIPVIIITGYSDLRTAIKVVRMGAFDYVTKPLIPDEILLTIKKAIAQGTGESVEAPSAGNSFKPARSKPGGFKYLFSDSPQSRNLEHQIDLVAPTDFSVIIYGESGAGKEGVARMIHEKSKRQGKPFVAMDCGAISKDLAGSELFGHEKGAFTGALIQKVGHFGMANGGTLLLDEVGNLSYEVQMLLLRVLQEKKLRKIGGTKEEAVDVRVIVASNERLTESIKKGKFREDLYHRLNEFSIEVPSLRHRKQDIMFFANHFLKETAQELGKNVNRFDPEVKNVFEHYPWYGNVRELKNVIKRAVLLSNGDAVEIKALPFEVLNYSHLEFDVPEETSYAEPKSAMDYEIAPQPAREELAASEPENLNPKLRKAAQSAEYEVILSVLSKVNFNKTKAAEMLGINRKTLYNKMKQMNLEK